MQSVLHEILFEPIGWLVIAITLASLGLSVGLHLFFRKKIREEEQKRATLQSSPVQSSPVQSSPVQSSPVQSSPVQSSPVQSSPVQSNQPTEPS